MLQILLQLSYEYNATFKVPFANVSQPLYVAYDGDRQREKVSFFNDADYTIWNGVDSQGVFDYKQVITYFDNEKNVSAQQCVSQPTYTGFDKAALQEMLPNLGSEDFKYVEDVQIFGKTYARYERHVIDVPTGDIPRLGEPDGVFVDKRDDYQDYYCEKVGENCVPYKWEFFGKNTLFGSHYDYYVLEIHSYNAAPVFEDSTFQVDLQCTEAPIISNATNMAFLTFFSRLTAMQANKGTQTGKNNFLTSANRFSALPREDVLALRGGYRRPLRGQFEYKHNLTGEMHWPEMTESYYVDTLGRKVRFPAKVDWRVRSGVTTVRDQCFCGSCWAFGTAAAIESRINVLFHDTLRPFTQISEQAFVDCLWSTDMMGCDGGEANMAIDRMVDMFGGRLPALADYPYLGQNMRCQKDKWALDGVRIRGFFNTEPGNDAQLMYALLSGPLTVAISVPDSMVVYAGGIYDHPDCLNTTTADLAHQVTVVGYDTADDGSKYWIIKNSWSNIWGADGYIFIKFGYCGVTLETTGAVLELVA